jgi:uncharacterized protein (DUF305 family)
MTVPIRAAVAAGCAVLVAGCAPAAAPAVPAPDAAPPAVVQPGAPGEEGRALTAEERRPGETPPHTEADVAFMQGMIAHHLQALEMAELAPGRTQNESVLQLARRIEASQADEIGFMEGWLAARDEDLPDPHAHHHGPHAHMPGMISAEEMARLRAASSVAFDRLFLEYMIRHHEGALVMVEELFAARGAGREPQIEMFASHVESDQEIEIERMARMLHQLR